MSCEKYEASIISYVLGELNEVEAAGCRAHIEACEHCWELFVSYSGVIESVSSAPEVQPTLAESEALSRALAGCELRVRTPVRHSEPVPQGLPVVILASVLAFLAVAGVLATQLLGYFDFAAALWAIGPVPVAVAVVMAVIITSFLPIAVAAKRRPLNGMTFRR